MSSCKYQILTRHVVGKLVLYTIIPIILFWNRRLATAGPDESGSPCRVRKGALLRDVRTRGHVAGASAGSFAHPTIQCEREALQQPISSQLHRLGLWIPVASGEQERRTIVKTS